MVENEIVINDQRIPVYSLNTVIIGSGAASLNCAVHLHSYGQKDIAIVTEKMGGGTSNNSGSDKQTYYKLSVIGDEPDSPYDMAKALYDGGAMHGDIALIEATLSVQEFFHLVNLGVKFPHNRLGGFVGYKTDHDPKQRATSAGPWTSSQMFQCLRREIEKNGIRVFDGHEVVALITKGNQAVGAVAIDKSTLTSSRLGMVIFHAENVVFGVGGPGGLYKTSVYPVDHLGAIGLALEVGAKAINLTESQYGLASIKFRWNVSGTYQQVIPRYISTDDSHGDEREFLNDYFPSMSKLATDIFLKGYQWPFDPRKISNYGSSLIDVLVYIETRIKGRRVFMDFRENPRGNSRIGGFGFSKLESEAYNYLKNSDALFGTPIERLEKMNPMAIELYANNGIDIKTEPLEIAVCAQHNNGGLVGDVWWESNIRHLFPVGEVNGTHGVYRPGGSALNSGQVGSMRAAQRIAKIYHTNTLTFQDIRDVAKERCLELMSFLANAQKSVKKVSVLEFRQDFQQRMSNYGAHIRDPQKVTEALSQAYEQLSKLSTMAIVSPKDIVVALQNRHLVLTHVAYLEAIHAYLQANGGSRGSYLVLDESGELILESLGEEWRYKKENLNLREKVLETYLDTGRTFKSVWKQRREIPKEESWFETVWSHYLADEIFGD